MNIKIQHNNSIKTKPYLKCLRLHTKLTLEQVAKKLHSSESQISRIELGQIDIDENEYKKIISLYGVNKDLYFDNAFMHQFDFLVKVVLKNDPSYLDDIKSITIDTTKKNNACLPYQYLYIFLQNFYLSKRDDKFLELGNFLKKFISLFTKEQQAIFYGFFGYTYVYLKDYKKGEYYLLKALDIKHDNELLKGVLLQYTMSLNNHKENYGENLRLGHITSEIFKRENCVDRYSKVMSLLAITYSKLGDYKKSIEMNKEILKLKESISKNSYYVSLYNIGYEYKKMEQYSNAIEYFEQAFEYFSDQETCFEIAWCYYKIDDKQKAKNYLERVKSLQKTGAYFEDLCYWLNEQLTMPYSLQCLKILKRIERKYEKTMGIESKKLLYLQLMECLEHRNEKNEALAYAKKLINGI